MRIGKITHEGAGVEALDKNGRRVVHGNDFMPEERVNPPVVIKSESRGSIGLGDRVKEPVLEEELI